MKKRVLYFALTSLLSASTELPHTTAATGMPSASVVSSMSITIQTALKVVISRGDLNAARLLGQAGIPLPLESMSLHVALCKKMWDIGQATRIPTVTHETILPEKPKKTEAELARIKEERQANLEAFQREAEAKEERRRADIKASKQLKAARDAAFEAAPLAAETQQSVVAKALKRARQADLIADLERQEEEEEKRRVRDLIRAKKAEGQRTLIQREQDRRTSFAAEYDFGMRQLNEELLLAVGLERNRADFYNHVVREKEKALARAQRQYTQYRGALSTIFETWNYKSFFVNISRLETEEGDPLHEINVMAKVFCHEHQFMKTRKLDPSLEALRNLLNGDNPFIEELKQLTFCFRDTRCLNPIKTFLFFDDFLYGLTRATIPPSTIFIHWERFLDLLYLGDSYPNRAEETQHNNCDRTRLSRINADINNDRNILNEGLEKKKLKYNIVRHIFDSDTDGILDLIAERARAANPEHVGSLIDVFAVLVFKGRHNAEKTSQAIEKFESIISRYAPFFADKNIINPLMELLRAKNISVDCLMPSHPTPLLKCPEFALSFLPQDPERDKVLKVDLSELSIYAWTKIMGFFNALPAIEKLMCLGYVIPYLEQIKKRFDVSARIFASDTQAKQAREFVLGYVRDWVSLNSHTERLHATKSLLPNLAYKMLKELMIEAKKYLNVNMLSSAIIELNKRLDFESKRENPTLQESFARIVETFPMDVFEAYEDVETRLQKPLDWQWRDWKAVFEQARRSVVKK